MSSPSIVRERARGEGPRSAWLGHPLARWIGPIAVVVLAAVLRLVNLGSPHTLVFDETFYVKDAWTLLNLGYEAEWPDEPNPAFEAGDVNSYLNDPAYVAHPPLGKWLIALGLAVFGAESAVGWRITTALAGIVLVVLTMVVARMLTHSLLLTTLAGLLLAIDGHAITLSRTALLDTSLAVLVLLGFVFLLLDRRGAADRLDRARRSSWGPVLWRRPWLVAMAVTLGLACGVKWSAAYVLAAFCLYALAADGFARRRAGIPFWISGTVLRQGPVTFALTVPIAALAYLSTWTGWLATSGGFFRDWASEPGHAWGGALAWVPRSLQSLWHYHDSIYAFHLALDSAHNYESPAWQWPLLLRPTSMYYDPIEGTADARLITSLANPIIWWGSVAAAIVLLLVWAKRRDPRHGVVLLGLAAGYLPWLQYPDRTMFHFYAIIFEPFLVLAVVLVVERMLRRGRRASLLGHPPFWFVAVAVALAVAVSAWFLPLWLGLAVPVSFLELHYWMPGWV